MKKRITKMSLIKEVDNEMCHNYYYVVNGRVYNKDGTRQKGVKVNNMFVKLVRGWGERQGSSETLYNCWGLY